MNDVSVEPVRPVSAGAVILVLLLSLFTACSGERPADLGVITGSTENSAAATLAPCPDSPNCVSSFESRESHSVAPLEASLREVEAAVVQMPRSNIVSSRDDYLYAEFTSRLMRFVDDVEFLVDPAAGVVHVRSASRLGHSDMGVNRERVEAIRAALDQQAP